MAGDEAMAGKGKIPLLTCPHHRPRHRLPRPAPGGIIQPSPPSSPERPTSISSSSPPPSPPQATSSPTPPPAAPPTSQPTRHTGHLADWLRGELGPLGDPGEFTRSVAMHLGSLWVGREQGGVMGHKPPKYFYLKRV